MAHSLTWFIHSTSIVKSLCHCSWLYKALKDMKASGHCLKKREPRSQEICLAWNIYIGGNESGTEERKVFGKSNVMPFSTYTKFDSRFQDIFENNMAKEHRV